MCWWVDGCVNADFLLSPKISNLGSHQGRRHRGGGSNAERAECRTGGMPKGLNAEY